MTAGRWRLVAAATTVVALVGAPTAVAAWQDTAATRAAASAAQHLDAPDSAAHAAALAAAIPPTADVGGVLRTVSDTAAAHQLVVRAFTEHTGPVGPLGRSTVWTFTLTGADGSALTAATGALAEDLSQGPRLIQVTSIAVTDGAARVDLTTYDRPLGG